MYLTTLDPISRDFDRIVRRAFAGGASRNGFSGTGPSWAPALPMDTVRRDGEVVLRFDVPGVDQDKIDVTVDKGVLTVSAVREDSKTEGENPVVRERLFGSFTRRVRLSDNLDAEAIEASHRDGVLEIRIPVREEAKPRKITVGAGEARELPAE
ncbi:MAG TPA: Hsp20/alpha crystallin family protein [Trebonia sp.]|jgi:HSP20 family protein|nr:Hsp20/alpha crystallin family protein [Trebonia sp.]